MKTRFTSSPASRRSLQALATAILITSPLHAADISWSGGEGDFNDTTNWTGGVLPGEADTAIVANGGMVWLTDARTLGALDVPDGAFGITPGQMLTSSGALTIGQEADALGKLDLDNGQLITSGHVTVGTAGGSGLFTFTNGFINREGSGSLVIGEGDDSIGEWVQFSGFINCMTALKVGSGSGATGIFDFTGQSAANVHDWLVIGEGGASGTFKLGGNGSFNKLASVEGTHVAIGRGNGSSGSVEQTGGRFINQSSDTYLGESGTATATWTLNDGNAVAVFSTLIMGKEDSASATFELLAGRLSAARIMKGDSTGSTSLVFNGGTLNPRADDPDFISGIDSLTVEDGGLIVDTSPELSSGFSQHDIGIALDLLDGGGGLTKRGPGTLTYEGTGHYSGATVVEGGTLWLEGELTASEVTVPEGGAFGGAGTVAGSVTAHGALVGRITASGSEPLSIGGDLNVEGATLKIELPDGPVASGPYVIATYDTRSGGDFAGIEGIAGYVVDYAYEGNQIAIVPGGSPYDTWAAAFTWESEGDELAEADPDGDGFANALEFFLGGDPLVSEPPAGKPSGSIVEDRFVFIFERSAVAASTVPVIEYGTGLDFPSVATDGEDGITITPMESPGGETWTVSFPMPPGGKLFARLKVVF